MTNRNNNAAALLRVSLQAQNNIKSVDARLRAVLAENEADRICGSWIGLSGNYSLTIRKQGGGYAAMLCDNTRLYKMIVLETPIELSDGALLIPEREAGGTPQKVVYQHRRVRLHFGEYGVFESEEAVLRRTDSYRCEEFYDPEETIL